MSDEHYGRTVRTLEVRRRLDPGTVAAIDRLLADAEAADGREPLSDQHRVDLLAGGGDGFAAVVASDDGRPVGYAQVSHGNCSSTVGLVVDPAHRQERVALGTELMTQALDVVRGVRRRPGALVGVRPDVR